MQFKLLALVTLLTGFAAALPVADAAPNAAAAPVAEPVEAYWSLDRGNGAMGMQEARGLLDIWLQMGDV
jgi:hypothetical protein